MVSHAVWNEPLYHIPGENSDYAPNIVTLGERQNFAVRICTGKKEIKEGTFTLSSLSEGLEIPIQSEYAATIKERDSSKFYVCPYTEFVAILKQSNIFLDTKQEIVLHTTESREIKLPECSAHQIIEFLVPYDGPWNESQFRVCTNLTEVWNIAFVIVTRLFL